MRSGAARIRRAVTEHPSLTSMAAFLRPRFLVARSHVCQEITAPPPHRTHRTHGMSQFPPDDVSQTDFEVGSSFGLPPVDMFSQRNEAYGALCRIHAADPSLPARELCKQVQHQLGLHRRAQVEQVFKNLVAGYAQDGAEFVYEPSKRNLTPGKTPGRTKRLETSPGFEKRCQTALRTAGNQRDGVAVHNQLAAAEGRPPMGETATKQLAEAAGRDPVNGVRAHKRVRQPMVTKVNRQDRKSMADIIEAAPRKHGTDRWELSKDTVMGDQFMVEMGSGDMESRWEYLRHGEMPTPISVVKCPAKLMINAWCGWDEKSPLLWCNQVGTLAGEKTWLKRFFDALEKKDGECEDEDHGEGEACMECDSCKKARKKAGHSFQELLEQLKPLMVDSRGRPKKGASRTHPPLKMWMDAAPCGWTTEGMDYLANECKAPRTNATEMKKGRGRVLYSPTHRLGKSAGSAADMTWMDSGVIRHFKLKLRKRLAEVDGGRRQVLDKNEMWELCQEVWNAIPIEDLRGYMTMTEERCKRVKLADGAWVGWSKEGAVRHGQST